MNNNQSSSILKKYQFFEDEEAYIDIPNKNKNQQPQSNSENKSNDKTKLKLSDISPSGISQMQSVEGVIFICGKALHKIKSKMIKENLIVKVINNEIIDEYRLFSGLYYDFKIKNYNQKPTFILIGGDLIRYVIKDKNNKFQEECMMVTSIKFYDISPFIEKKFEKYETSELESTEQYSKLLLKKLKILKNTSTNELLCNHEGDSYEGYESFQNVIAFAINNSFSHIALGSDNGDIILISGYPDLISCKNSDVQIKFLPKIVPKDRELHLTNLELSELSSKKDNNINKRVLYATTASAIYYYEWKYEKEKSSITNKNIKLKYIIEEGGGAYSNCIAVKNNYFLYASSNDDSIVEYNNLNKENTWVFEGGNKIYIQYFKNYILFVSYNEKSSFIRIFDKINKFLVYENEITNKIYSICCDEDFIYLLYEEKKNNKTIKRIKEKENKKKFDIFFSRNLYDVAMSYAENINCNKEKTALISRRYAEFEYSRGEFKKSIEQYIKTINYLNPSNVINKFLEKAKLDYLIEYLEAIENNSEFQTKHKNNKNYYPKLLFSCYIVQEKITQLKNFLKNKTKNEYYNTIKTAIDVCLDTNNVNLAIYIAKQKQMNYELLEILILKLNNLTEALEYIFPTNNSDDKKRTLNKSKTTTNSINDVNDYKEKIKIIFKFGKYFLNGDSQSENISDIFFNKVSSFIEKNKAFLNNDDIINLVQVFISSDKYFKPLFDKINLYGIEYNQKIIHRRIELFLEEKENGYQKKILQILKDERFLNKYDNYYLLILFKFKNFQEGYEYLTEKLNLKQDIIKLNMNKKDYKTLLEILNIYIKNLRNINNSFEISHISFILKFFIEEKKSNQNNKEFDQIYQQIISKIADSNIFLNVELLDIIYEIDNSISLNEIINIFYMKKIDNYNLALNDSISKVNEISINLNNTENQIKNYNTKATAINLKKCNECDMEITFPCICFLCGHCYHQLCVNSRTNINDKNSLDNVECPKCKKNKNKIMQDIINGQKLLENITDNQSLEKEKDKSFNKINFLYGLYGKGIFNLNDPDNE